MVIFQRQYQDGNYFCRIDFLPLEEVANKEKKIPLDWIKADGTGLELPFLEYVLPLVQGEPTLPLEESLPRFAMLKRIRA